MSAVFFVAFLEVPKAPEVPKAYNKGRWSERSGRKVENDEDNEDSKCFLSPLWL